MTRDSLRALIVCLAFLCPLSGGCSTTPPVVVVSEDDSALRVLRDSESAFNRHDAEAMAQFWDPDVQIFRIDGSTMVEGVTGRDQLREFMQGYFDTVSRVKSVIDEAMVSGPYVAFREQVSWVSEGTRRQQTAMGVYEVRNGLIRRVWYFPAER